MPTKRIPNVKSPTLRDKLSRLMFLFDELAGLTEEEVVDAFDNESELVDQLSWLESIWQTADGNEQILPLSGYAEALSSSTMSADFREQALRHLRRLNLIPST